MLFYATFTTGLHEPVAQLVKSAGLSIKKMLDGALIYENSPNKSSPNKSSLNISSPNKSNLNKSNLNKSNLNKSSPIESRRSINHNPTNYLPCFVNVYEILSWRDVRGHSNHTSQTSQTSQTSHTSDGGFGSLVLKKFMKEAAANPGRFGLQCAGENRKRVDRPPTDCISPDRISPDRPSPDRPTPDRPSPDRLPEKKHSFRIVVSVENKLVSTDANIKRRLEQQIAACTGLTVDRGGAGEEFWFLYRREGAVFFMRRLTTHTAYEKTLRKGELHPELAYMLNVIADTADIPHRVGGVMLDPFCGYGAIPVARLRHFADAAVYAADIDGEKVRITRTALRSLTQTDVSRNTTRVEVRQNGIDRLSAWLPEQSVDVIVTDPPWGLYDGSDTQSLSALSEMYQTMLISFLRVLKIGGIMVVLTSQKALLRELLSCGSTCSSSTCSSDACNSDAWKTHHAPVLVQSYDILVSGKKAGVFVLRHV